MAPDHCHALFPQVTPTPTKRRDKKREGEEKGGKQTEEMKEN